MAAILEVEDDVFSADLSHQISLLLMDDDEELAANVQASTRAITSATQRSVDQTSRRERRGTGVFIPRYLPPTRNDRQGRFTANPRNRIKFQRETHNSRGFQFHHANYGNENSTYNSFYRRRF